ncbi:sulfotransferase family protein [Nonomuraea dietziae]|uniref:sulfotransferase family protein n=1 Tax=Nonomuraea dietziae TaxID=65515 RepID=UPI0033F0B23A
MEIEHTSIGSGIVRSAPATVRSRPTAPAPRRLVQAPVIVLSSPRAGSTLLRLILGSHSRLHAPHELHLGEITVTAPFGVPSMAMQMLGHDQADLEHLLWDRILHVELERSGKQTMVVKNPGDVFVWQRIASCWPDARYVFLLRHPASVLASWVAATGHPAEASTDLLLRWMTALDQARTHLPGLTIRYEDLTTDPAAVVRRVCQHVGVEFEPSMLDYGDHTSGRYVRGVGDWLDRIRTGRIQPARELPDQSAIPEPLGPLCAAWGYT